MISKAFDTCRNEVEALGDENEATQHPARYFQIMILEQVILPGA
jgi:hypothetical protein